MSDTPEPRAAAPSADAVPTPPPRFTLLPQDPQAAEELGRALDVAPVLAQVLLNRGYGERDQATRFLAPRLSELTRPDAMADRAAAAARLALAVRRGERIVVFGDYDVDGTTSCAILSDILERLGGDVRAFVANRFDGGYGFSDAALARALAMKPQLIVTCDCGSSDHARLAEARAQGVDTIVVDHHLVPAEPLPALAFLNPHRPDCGFAYKGLCSAGLALSLGAALRAELGSSLDLRAWLDLVALGTIADLAPLDGDNRSLVRAGLARLASSEARPGVVALREAARLRAGEHLGAQDVAFRLAPRLNAAGRLGDPQVTLDLLRAPNLERARQLAARIERINNERKDVERATTAAALGQAAAMLEQGPMAGLVVAGEGWHRGVVGITAARLVDALGLPVLVVGLEGGHGHGSGRAPDGFPLYDALCRCAPSLERYGGHHAAVGLSVKASEVEALRASFVEACAELETDPDQSIETSVDAQLGQGSTRLPKASELARFEPLGASNPEPVFAIEQAQVRSADSVGEGHLKLLLDVGGQRLSAFGYEMAKGELPAAGSTVRLFGNLRPDTWRGGEAVELRIVHLETGPRAS